MIYEVKTKYTVVKTFEIEADNLNEDNVDDFIYDDTKTKEADYWESDEEVIEIKEIK